MMGMRDHVRMCVCVCVEHLDLAGLDLAQALGELGPVAHDGCAAAALELLGHLVLLLGRVGAHVANALDVGAEGRGGARLAVLDSDGLLSLGTELLQGVVVDGRVRLRGGLGEGGGGGEDVLGVKETVLVDLVQAGGQAAAGRGADDREVVLALGL